MKKLLSLILAICLVLSVLPVLAETAAGTETAAEAPEGQGGSLSDLLGGLFGGSTEGQEGQGGSLDELLGGLFGSGSTDGQEGSLSEMFNGLLEKGKEKMNNGLEALKGLVEKGKEGLSSGLESLKGLLGGENGQGFDLGSLLSTMGLQKGEEVKTVSAENAEQFFGTWVVKKTVIDGYEVTPEFMQEIGMESNYTETLSAEKIVYTYNGEEMQTEAVTACDFADGVLTITADGRTYRLQMTESGEMIASASLKDMGVELDGVVSVTFARAE